MAATDHFADQGWVYWRTNGNSPLVKAGVVNTVNISANEPIVAAVDRAGNVYCSVDAGMNMSRVATRLPAPGSVLIL